MKIQLNNEETRILWIVLNNAQSSALMNLALISKITDSNIDKAKNDWAIQTAQEYDIIQGLKTKLSQSTKR